MHPPHVCSILVLAMLASSCGGPVVEASDQPARDASLAFMLGCWQGPGSDGSEAEEHYRLGEDGSAMEGTTTLSANGAVVMRETTVITLGSTPVLTPTLDGEPSVPFALVSVTANRATFANPTHDFPTRIVYATEGPGRLTARIEGTQSGEVVAIEWQMSAVPCPSPE